MTRPETATITGSLSYNQDYIRAKPQELHLY